MTLYCFACGHAFCPVIAETCPTCTWHACPKCQACLCNVQGNVEAFRAIIYMWLSHVQLDEGTVRLWLEIADKVTFAPLRRL